MTRGDETVLLRARTVLPAADTQAINDGAVLTRSGSIVAVGSFSQLRDTADLIIDVGELLMPGMIDAHSHLRGMPLGDHGIPPRSLESWLCTLSAMAPLNPRDEAVVATVGLLQTGITAVQGFVHVPGSADSYREAAAQIEAGVTASGIRALLILGHTDRAERAPEPADGAWALVPPSVPTMNATSFAEFASLWLDSRPKADGDLVRWGIGPVGAQWSTDEALAKIASLAGDRRLHTHLNESRLHRKWLGGQEPPAARLEHANLFDHRLAAAHGVHLTTAEIACAAAKGVTLVHCPTSNRALSVGRARVGMWLRSGVTAALGLDSQNVGIPDAFAVMRDALRTSQELDDPLRPEQVLALATTGGGHAIGIGKLGRLAPGAPADMVALHLSMSSRQSPEIAAELIDRGSVDAVRSVWVAGIQRVQDGVAIRDVAPERRRLQAVLDFDRTAREQRLAALEPMLAAVDRATATAARLFT